jgi:hypothetical protein
MNKLLISDIENLLEKENILKQRKEVFNIFISAINDWPKTFDNLDDYESDVNEFIQRVTKKVNIEDSLMKIDFNKNAWEAESLSQLLLLFDYYDEDLSLKEIIALLKE